MSLFQEFFYQVYWLAKETAPYMLFGIVFAGFLRYAVSAKRFTQYLGGNDLKSVTMASLFGIPLPLCSCSVLPMMISLRERGASKGATTAFLISTPETGVDSISVTYALLDPIFTVVRPIAALISALFTGSVVNLFVRRKWDENGEEAASGKENCCTPLNDEGEGSITRRAFRYGFITLLDDLTPLLILAFTLSGLIAVFLPDNFFDNPVTQGWSGMFIMLFVGIPLYVCATSSTPLVAALLLKGLSPGAALVFLLAGPVTNIGTIVAVMKYMGKRIMVVYVVCTAAVTLLMGGIIESIYSDLGISVTAIVGKTTEFMPEGVKVTCFGVLVLLMAVSARRTSLVKRWGEKLKKRCEPLGIDPSSPRAKLVYLVIVALLYLTTSLSVVDLGEEGWLFTFGEVKRDAAGAVVVLEPGLQIHAPYPFQNVVTGRPDEVRSLSFGFRRDAGDPLLDDDFQEAMDLAAEAEVMDGNESLVSVKFTVQFRLVDAYAYTMGFDDPEALIRDYAAASVRCVCAERSTQDILVGHRRQLEIASRALLQRELDLLACGAEVLRVSFIDVHAPPEVHYAFRDVASAAEEKHQQELEGESALRETLAEARGRAYRIEQEALSFGHERENAALGRARAFEGRSAAYRAARDITRLRMYLATMENVLAPLPLIMPLHKGIDVELWVRDEEEREPPFLEEEKRKEEVPAPARKPDEPDWFQTLRNKK